MDDGVLPVHFGVFFEPVLVDKDLCIEMDDPAQILLAAAARPAAVN